MIKYLKKRINGGDEGMVHLNASIGIFDSGMGGISVLGEAIRQMPTESFIYYGDSANAPYGVRDKEDITRLSMEICDFMMTRQVKAILVACNTATSAAVHELRKRYSIPVIGMEPALKPAVMENKNKSVAVLATDVTLKEEKFNNLMQLYINCSDIVKIPAPELVQLVENGEVDYEVAEGTIKKLMEPILSKNEISAVVLGCTHFIFLRPVLQKILGENVKIYDGNAGTVKHLQNVLIHQGIYNKSNENPCIEIINSDSPAMLKQSYHLLEYYRQL